MFKMRRPFFRSSFEDINEFFRTFRTVGFAVNGFILVFVVFTGYHYVRLLYGRRREQFASYFLLGAGLKEILLNMILLL